MTEWAIRIPYRTRDDPLDVDAVVDLPELLDDPEDQAVARELLVEASTSGLMTVGQLLDQLERASPPARRATLDRMRVAAGLDTTADAEAHDRYVAANTAPTPPRDAAGNTFKTCAAAGCGVVPSDPATGLPTAVADRRWWCPEHRHMARPDDRLTPEQGRIDPRTMAYTPPPSEVERLEREAERLREEDRRRNAARAAEAEAHERFRDEHAGDPTIAFPPFGAIPQSRFIHERS